MSSEQWIENNTHPEVDFLNSTYLCLIWPWRESSLAPVAGCEQVMQPLVCNMTKVFKDLRDNYIIQVQAHLEGHTSEPAVIQALPVGKWQCGKIKEFQ